MPESIIRAVVFFLLAISTTALSTASFVLKLRQSGKKEADKTLQEAGLDEVEFYSSSLDQLLAAPIDRHKDSNTAGRNAVGKLHLAARNGDLVNTTEKIRKAW